MRKLILSLLFCLGVPAFGMNLSPVAKLGRFAPAVCHRGLKTYYLAPIDALGERHLEEFLPDDPQDFDPLKEIADWARAAKESTDALDAALADPVLMKYHPTQLDHHLEDYKVAIRETQRNLVQALSKIEALELTVEERYAEAVQKIEAFNAALAKAREKH